MVETYIVGIAEAGTVGMIEEGVEGTIEIDTVDMAETGAAGVVGEGVVGIAVSAAISGSSRIFVIKRMNMQNKWILHQEVKQIHIKGKGKKMAMIKGEEKT